MPLLGGGARQRILNIFNRAQGANYGWMYAKSPAVRTVIDEIVRAVGELDLRVYEEVSESERQPKPDHPAALSMRYPNEFTTSDGFIRSLMKDWLIHDNAYAVMLPAAGNQLNLMRIPSYMVEVQGSSLFAVDNYRIWPQGAWTNVGSWGGAGTWVDISPDQMLHWHGEHPEDPRIGLSHLDTLRGVIAEDAALQQATVELAQANLQEPAWVFRPLDAPQWSNAARAGFEEDLTNRMRRRNQKPVVLEEGMEMRSFGISPHDAQMMELRRWAVAQVASEYNVPSGKVGLTPATQEDEDAFVADVLKPCCKNFAKMLNQRILVRVYDWPDGTFEFDLDERLIGNERLRALTSASGRAVMLTNEARAKLNLPPIDGGDELVTPLNVIVGEKPSPQVMPIQDPNAPPQDGSYRSDQPGPPDPVPPKALGQAFDLEQVDGGWIAWPKALSMSTNGISTLLTGPRVSLRDANAERLPQFHPRKAADMERQRRNIDVFKGIMQGHFNRLERSLRGKAMTDWSRWDRELADDFEPALQRTVQAEGDIYALKLASPENFDMGQVQHYLRAMAEGAATAINDTIRQEIDDLGFDDAMGRAAQHVASAGTSLGARSTMWAREEAARQAPGFRGQGEDVDR